LKNTRRVFPYPPCGNVDLLRKKLAYVPGRDPTILWAIIPFTCFLTRIVIIDPVVCAF